MEWSFKIYLTFCVLSDDNDKANNELISLLAAVTMPTNGNKPSQGHMTKSSTWSIKTSMSQLSQDSPRNGLKVRMVILAVKTNPDSSSGVSVHHIGSVVAEFRSNGLELWCFCSSLWECRNLTNHNMILFSTGMVVSYVQSLPQLETFSHAEGWSLLHSSYPLWRWESTVVTHSNA